ncbi:MAG: DUF3486 family protein [Rhizobiales bacterium]|nr:DUF3486 family protein [Hyphomicrobiales bacterium]
MARSSSIKRLPPKIREVIDSALKAGVSIDDIVAAVRSAGAEVSRSAVGRYKQEVDRVGARLVRSREISQVFAERLGAAPEGKTGRLILELLQTVIFDLLVPQDDGETPKLDTKAIGELSRAIRDLLGAEKVTADRELKIRQEAERAAKAQAAEAIEQVAKQGGISAKTAAGLLDMLGVRQ